MESISVMHSVLVFFFSVSQIDPLAIGKRAMGQKKTMFKVVIKGKQFMARLKHIDNQHTVSLTYTLSLTII